MIKYKCGHDSALEDDTKYQWKISTVERSLCPECEREVNSLDENMPELTGSEKQIAWAVNIRARHATRWRHANFDARPLIEERTSAKWWIETRYDTDTYFSREVDRLRRQEMDRADMELDWAAIKEQHDSLIRPDGEPVTSVFVLVAAYDWGARVKSPRFVEPLADIVKQYGFRWEKEESAWELSQPLCGGDYGDRAAEAGRALLDAGIPIECHDEEVRRKIAQKDWFERAPKWVAYFPKQGELAIYSDDDKSILKEALKISRARNFTRSGYVVVPVASADQVADFADQFDLVISAAAKEILDKFNEEVLGESLLDTD